MTPAAGLMTQSATLPNGVTLEYVEQGDRHGVPVLLLHGVTDSWRSFEPVLPHLPRSIRAVAPSQRGHGRSSRPAAGYRFVDFSDDLGRFMDALRIDRAVIVGHSMGGGVAQRFAIDHPDRTIGLVLAGSSAGMRGNPAVAEFWQSGVSTLTDPVSRAFARAFQESTIAEPIPAPMLDTFVDESLTVPAHVWRATFAHFLEFDGRADLARLTAPTLILWGDRDGVTGRVDQEVLVGAISGARLLVYGGTGHALHWEQPQRFAADVTSFVHQLGEHR